MQPSDERPPSGLATTRASASSRARRERRRRTRAVAGVGVLVTILLIGAKILVEATDFGRELQLMTYNLLQLRLESSGTPDVVVVNTRSLPRDGPPDRLFTARKPLLDLVTAIAEQGPRAIGVDIDMAPDAQGYMDGVMDPYYFRSFLEIWGDRCIPVFLGAHRTNADDAQVWLGNEEFSPLAAAIMIPRDTRKMVKFVVRSAPAAAGTGAPSASSAVRDEGGEASSEPAADSRCSVPIPDPADLVVLDSISHGLAMAFLAGTTRTRWLESPAFHRLVEPYSQRRVSEDSPYWVGEFFVDYGHLAGIRRGVLDPIDPSAIRASRGLVEGRVVLLGNVTNATDRFVVPGHLEEGAVPGVFLHASAVQTLIDGPLFELTPTGRVLVDLSVSIGIILAIAAIRLRYEHARDEVHSERLQSILTGIAVLAVVFGAFVIVKVTRVMWDDALLVVGVLLVHRRAERAVESLHGLRDVARTVWHWILFRRPGERP